MDIREHLRQKYQNLLNQTSQITQKAIQIPSQISQTLKRRREAYQINIDRTLQHIRTAKNFIQQKQKQEQRIIKEYNERKSWATKRAKNISYQLERQQSLKLTLSLLKQSKMKMKEHQTLYEEVKRSLSVSQVPQTIKINQYQSLVNSIKNQSIGNNMEMQTQKNVLKQTKIIPKNVSMQRQQNMDGKNTKKQVSFTRSQSYPKSNIKVDLKNQNLELKVTSRQGFKSLKNYQFSFNQEKQIFVPRNPESKETKQVLRNFNYHKDVKGLQKQLAKLS